MIHASYLSHISEDVILAPESKLNDGVIWLVVVRNGISRASFLQVRIFEIFQQYVISLINYVYYLYFNTLRLESFEFLNLI